MTARRTAVAATAVAMVLAGCGSDKDGTGASSSDSDDVAWGATYTGVSASALEVDDSMVDDGHPILGFWECFARRLHENLASIVDNGSPDTLDPTLSKVLSYRSDTE